MALTAATILFILFWIHQFFQLGVPDDAYFYMQCMFNQFSIDNFELMLFSAIYHRPALFADPRQLLSPNLL